MNREEEIIDFLKNSNCFRNDPDGTPAHYNVWQINAFSAFNRYQKSLNKSFDGVIKDIDTWNEKDIFLSKKIIEFAAKSYAYKFLTNELLKVYQKNEADDK